VREQRQVEERKMQDIIQDRSSKQKVTDEQKREVKMKIARLKLDIEKV